MRALVSLEKRRLPVSAQALRYKLLKHKQGTLFVFAIDASGSMAANRIARAKSTILKLLRKSYLNRDSVAIVSFHGTTANVDLPPSRSILRARRVLDSLRMGGSTPLGLGLVTTIELLELVGNKFGETVVLLFTDGRSNVPLQARWSELARVPASKDRVGAERADRRAASNESTSSRSRHSKRI